MNSKRSIQVTESAAKDASPGEATVCGYESEATPGGGPGGGLGAFPGLTRPPGPIFLENFQKNLKFGSFLLVFYDVFVKVRQEGAQIIRKNLRKSRPPEYH